MLDTATFLDESLARLFAAPEDLPDEVRACLERGQLGPHVQKIPAPQITSEAPQRRLAAQIAAVANGALSLGMLNGYLVFERSGATLRFTDEGDNAPKTHQFDQLPLTDLSRIFSQLVESWLDPLGVLEVVLPQDSAFAHAAFLRVGVPKPNPVFAKTTDEHGHYRWFVPVWEPGDAWRLREADREEVTSVFEAFIRGVLQENGVERAITEHILGVFHRLQPVASDELIGFFAGLFVRPEVEVRAAAAGSLIRIGGLGAEVKRLAAQLLVALVQDDPQVAVQAMASLQKLGGETQTESLVNGIRYHEGDTSTIRMALRCIGEIGSPSDIGKLTSLYETLPNECSPEIDDAIARLYHRHDLRPFDLQTQMQFRESVRGFQYSRAAELLRVAPMKICPLREHRRLLQALVQYEDHRFMLNAEGARLAMEQTASVNQSSDDGFKSVINRWLTDDLPPSNETLAPSTSTRKQLAELFFCAEVSFILLNYTDFSARLYNFVEQATRFVAREQGILLSADGKQIDHAWLDSDIRAAQQLKVKKLQPNKASRISLCALLELYSDKEGIAEYIRLVNKFEPVVKLRHEAPMAHGMQPVTQAACEKAYGTSVQSMIDDVRQLYQLCTGVELGENPFVALNLDVLWILDRANKTLPKATDLLDA